jgi:hypothetical protein
MTKYELRELFEKHSETQYIQFERVETKRSNRPDLHAFLLLDELVPGDRDIIACGEHDEVYLSIDEDELAAVVTKAQVIELVRCGVRCDGNGLCMFV